VGEAQRNFALPEYPEPVGGQFLTQQIERPVVQLAALLKIVLELLRI